MSMPCVVPPMLWSLDELKSSLLDEFPILTTSEGEGYIKYCLTPLFNNLRLHVSSFFDLGNLGMLGLISTAHTQKSTHSTGDIALRAHIVLGAHTQKSSYSARILRNHRTRQMGAHTAKIGKIGKKGKKRKKQKKNLQRFFFFFFFRLKSLGI